MDDLCICGHTRAEHGQDQNLDDLGCEGFELTKGAYSIEPISNDRNLWRIIGPSTVKGAWGKQLAQSMADDLNHSHL